MTMTHAGVDPEHRKKINITEKMIRISVGVENAEDIINDIKQAFKAVSKKKELSLS
jgi:cystathionine beta-lyase/cystathionine gamma-synthase